MWTRTFSNNGEIELLMLFNNRTEVELVVAVDDIPILQFYSIFITPFLCSKNRKKNPKCVAVDGFQSFYSHNLRKWRNWKSNEFSYRFSKSKGIIVLNVDRVNRFCCNCLNEWESEMLFISSSCCNVDNFDWKTYWIVSNRFMVLRWADVDNSYHVSDSIVCIFQIQYTTKCWCESTNRNIYHMVVWFDCKDCNTNFKFKLSQ